MRKLLAAAVALAPIAVAAGVHAETVVNDTRTTPIATATANNGAADDVTLGENGRINLKNGAAITLNSNNNVTVNPAGQINFTDADDGAVGILALGGNTGSIVMNGHIRIDDGYTATDTDSDGDLDGPFAEGTGRYGIRVTGPGALDGDITTGRNSNITVEGNQSYGLSLESDLTGDLFARGVIRVTGDESYGLRTTGAVSGDVRIAGDITAQGEASTGVSIEGDVGGRLTIESIIATTGFRYTTRPPDSILEKLDADDFLVGGPALRIAADVGGGVLLGIAPTDEDKDNDDEDNDGVPDAEQGVAAISSLGSAPAIEIGSTARDITLGLVGTGDQAYGFINHGGVTANGVYDGFEATGILIGGGGHAVTVAGGILNTGGVEARAFEADAFALRLADGADVPHLQTSGTIASLATSQNAHTTTALRIDAGASLTSLYNAGRIQAAGSGSNTSAYAIHDLSGSLSVIDNIGVIQAATVTHRDSDNNVVPVTGSAVAIDVSNNTTGVTLTQHVLVTDPDNPPASGIIAPVITGDVLLGSGADVVDIRDGFLYGRIDFGAGADSLLISGDAEVRGVLANADGQLSINISGGLLDARQDSALTISDLTVGADGKLILSIDPVTNAVGGFNVTGAASIADGAGLGVRLASLIDAETRFTVIRAGTLTFGDIDQTSLQDNSPYMFVIQAGADEAAGEVFVDVRRRTATEIGMIGSETSAYDAVYAALGQDTELRQTFLDQTGRDGFIGMYQQLLPDHSGGGLISLASGVDAVTRALAGRNTIPARGETSAWMQEINFYADRETGDAYGFTSEGFGLAGGVDRGVGLGAVGVSVAFTSSDLEDPHAQAEERLTANLIELGLYWRAHRAGWNTWARVGAGYASFESVRQFVGGGILRRSEADWNGYTLSAGAGASYEHTMGRYVIRPEITAEYFSLDEDGFEESGGGAGFDLGIEDRSGHIFSSTATVSISRSFGEEGWLRPEIRLGWRHIISHDGGVTTARFLSGGPAFALGADSLEGGGPVIGFRLTMGNQLGLLTVEGDAELLDDYIRYAVLLRASFRF